MLLKLRFNYPTMDNVLILLFMKPIFLSNIIVFTQTEWINIVYGSKQGKFSNTLNLHEKLLTSFLQFH